MSGLASLAGAVAGGPPLALLGLSFGLGHRFGSGPDLWPGVTATVAASVMGVLSPSLGAPAAATVAVLMAIGVPLLGAPVVGRVPLTPDPGRRATASLLALVTVLAAVALLGPDTGDVPWSGEIGRAHV